MPLIREEPQIFPETLFDRDISSAPWVVAHVRSRQEKVLARHLLERGVAYYLPQVKRSWKSEQGRTRSSFLPLFTGYVFLRGGRDERQSALRSNVVVALIDVTDQERLDAELRQLYELQQSGASLEPYEALTEGDAIVVKSGAFAGYRGRVVQERGRDRLIVEVSLIAKAVAVEFPRAAVSRAR